MPAPQLSVGLPSFAAEDPGDWRHLLDLAAAYDAAGVDRLVVSDHVVFGERLEEYGRNETGGQAGGRQPTGPDGDWLDPLIVLSAAIGVTHRIRLGTNILLAALRRPVVLAKDLATMDVLSGGRIDLGVGVGWQREEYEAAGLAYDGRGRLLDHTLEVIQTLWRDRRAEHADDLLRFEAIHQMPKPRQTGGVPIWVSGRVNTPVARRIARFGVGWIPWADDANDLPASIPAMKEAVRRAGGDPTGLQVRGGIRVVLDGDRLDIGATMSPLPGLLAAGVTDVLAYLPMPRDPERAAELLGPLVTAFRAAV